MALIHLLTLRRVLVAGACLEDEKPVSNVHRSACLPACDVQHSLCHHGTCICRRGFEGTYLRGQLQHCEVIALDVRQTEAPFDSSPTWLYVVSGVAFVCIIAASVIVLICRYITSRQSDCYMVCAHVFTGSIARTASRQYLVYSEADFEVFRPAGATRCTDWGEIWHGGGDQ